MALTRRAGWILGGLAALLVAVVCVRLGLWQLDRLEQRRAANAAFAAALELPPLELPGPALDSIRRDPQAYMYRRAVAAGSPIPDADILWRGRSLEGRPGVNLLTPFRLTGTDSAVLVNRGWAESPDAATLDPGPLAEPDLSTVEGIVFPLAEGDAAARPIQVEVDGRTVPSVQRPERGAVQFSVQAPLVPIYLQQLPSAGDPELPRRLAVPDLRAEGSHLGYAIQWFSFAAIALGGYLLLLLRTRGA